MKKSLKVLAVLGIILFSSGCNKEKLKGPQGDPGPQGAPGVSGTDGKNAEVVSTGEIVVQASQWITQDSLQWRAVINSTMITQEVVERGSVQVFIKQDNIWHVLPLIEHTTFLTFGYEVGRVHLIIEDSHGSKPHFPETATYKLTIISDAERVVKTGVSLVAGDAEKKE